MRIRVQTTGYHRDCYQYRSRCLPFYLPATRLGALAGAAPRLLRWSATTQPSAFTAAQAAPPSPLLRRRPRSASEAVALAPSPSISQTDQLACTYPAMRLR